MLGTDGGFADVCSDFAAECIDTATLRSLIIDPTGQRMALLYPDFVLLFASSGGAASIDLGGETALSGTFSPDGYRLYLGTALGRIYEIDTSQELPAYPQIGLPDLISPLRSAVAGFPIQQLVPDPAGDRLVILA